LAVHLSPASRVSPSRIRAIAALADEHPGTLRLFVGEDTRPTPEFIKRAAVAAVEANKTYYTPNAGYPELRAAIATSLGELHGVEIDPARQVVVTSSGMNAIVLAIQATLGAGDSALVLTPLWPNTAAAIRVAGAEAIEVPLRFGTDGYTLDLDDLQHRVKPNTRLLALASPGNPTGWMATREDWSRIVDFCERHDLWLLADAVYERMVYSGTVAPSPFSQIRGRDRLIVVNSLSKSYRMTGWRLGYVVGPPDLGRIMTSLQEFVVSNAPGIVQAGGLAALVEGEEFIRESQARYARHARLAVDRLSKLEGVQVYEPGGAFYVFPKLEGLEDSNGFCERLVRRHRLGLAPGSAFGAGGEGHVRLCFAVEESILVEALDRFAACWRGCLVPDPPRSRVPLAHS
jgi:aspartate/methionine/tyrosine aminotransferase